MLTPSFFVFEILPPACKPTTAPTWAHNDWLLFPELLITIEPFDTVKFCIIASFVKPKRPTVTEL